MEACVGVSMVGAAMREPTAYTLSYVFFARFLQRLSLRNTITVGLGALCAASDFLPLLG